ncbi:MULTISPECIES: hypothetical protein [unclassified Streptomyces]|uniref:hypothetical protein n=1 Tax=unclassified Streptomyces TaxID=2593676 RepID=UPI000375EFE0|nr:MULTISPECIES: hypothetical protein [unclassified Streptomyces]MYQ78126.1 hypothetical protein [Streptomyces sp. SID4923]
MSGEPEPRSAAEDEQSPTTAPTDEAADAAPSDRPQEAWAARRDLEDHVPRTMAFGAETRLAGGVLGGVNHGIGGGLFHGDVHVDARTHVHYGFGSMSAARSSGEIRAATLSGIAACFADPGPAFTTLVDQLREERVLVLSGPQSSGRRTAALMLLHRLGLSPVHSLARNAEPHSLLPEGDEDSGAKGHLLCDLETDRNKPLRDVDLLALRDRLGRQDAYLVITVGPRACLEDVETVAWQPPAPADVLTAHLRSRLDEDSATALLALPVVTEFLARDHQPRETSAFASVLVEHASGNASGEEVDKFSLAALEDQVREWFEEDDTVLHLREKSFLIALAAFDDGPYALTAEVSDRLYARLQETADSQLPAAVPVFGTHIGRRLQRARAHRYEADEPTEWGPVRQVKAAFRDDRTSLVLLREVWTGHPSARPALVQWLQELAKDGRPLVRTRASSTVAVLAHTDLPSAMALVIEPWAASPLYGPRTVAVHALALAHRIGTPNVPQILDAWCDSDALHLRWVAIRTHGLIGPERPVETLAALRTAAHREGRDEPDEFGDQDDGQLAEALAESVELLLLSTARCQVLEEILRVQVRDQRMRTLAVNGFLGACGRTERGVPKGRSLVLDWYAESLTTHTPAATGIRSLMRTALNDRDHRKRALDALRRWVFSVEGAPGTEGALAHLLSGIAVDEPERRRISHLLRTLPGEDGTPPPVANRLLAALPTL